MGNRTKCILMWRWIVDHPGSSKEDWIDAHPQFEDEIYDHNSCYACKENDERLGHDFECEACPVNWNGIGGECLNSGSPYTDWESRSNHRHKHAIRVLKVIEETWTI